MIKDVVFWKEHLEKLKSYYKEHGNFHVPVEWKKDKTFSRWVENIRKYPQRLPDKLFDELLKIKFDFKASPDWNAIFSKLEAFHEKYGHTYVPSSLEEFEELFDWTVNQRRARSILTTTQIKKLDSLRFGWEILTDKEIRWEQKYRELADFKKKYGHAKVPQDFKEDLPLGRWVSAQRRKKTENSLTKDRIKKLDSIGFLWKEDIATLRNEAWEKRYNQLARYKKINGHIDRIKIRKDYYQLGLWVETQMIMGKRMSPYRKKKLDAIGFNWEKGDIHEQKWNEMYERLRAYKAEHRHCRVKKREDFRLSVWLQRNKRDRDKIGTEKKKKLESLGVKWPHELHKEMWEFRFNELKAFRKKHEDLNVGPSGKQLHEWIQTQKRLKDENKLSKERFEKLKAIGFVWKGEVEKKKMKLWESLYKKFKALKENYGSAYHIRLKEYPELDRWVARQIHSKEKLSGYKKKKLNVIGFSWKRSGYYHRELWENMYQQLSAFKNKYGHCDVPQKFPENQNLAMWVNGQRIKKLSTHKKTKLNKLGFSWAGEITERKWRQRVNEFIDMKKKGKLRELHSPMPLYSWWYQQRKNFHKLPDEKKKILLRAGIVDKS